MHSTPAWLSARRNSLAYGTLADDQIEPKDGASALAEQIPRPAQGSKTAGALPHEYCHPLNYPQRVADHFTPKVTALSTILCRQLRGKLAPP
jgi:hypothetical protein